MRVSRRVRIEEVRREERRLHSVHGISGRPERFIPLTTRVSNVNRAMAQTVIEKTLRVRIVTGFSLIIALTLLIAGWSYYHISTLGQSAENLFVANYRSIQYALVMERAVGSLDQSVAKADIPAEFAKQDSTFRDALQLENGNLTENGERDLNKRLSADYESMLTAIRANDPNRNELRKHVTGDIEQLRRMNEQAMFGRSENVKGQANFARISTLGITALLVSIAILLAIAVSRRSLAEFIELDRAKSNFVATAAHELKNPLSSVKTSSGLLLDGIAGELTAMQTEIVSTIRNECERLMHLVKELLDLARLETGTLPLSYSLVDVETILDASLVPVMFQSSNANVRIETVVMENVPPISVDANKISWAVSNLLSNAIRYSPRGSIITVTATRNADRVWIAVRDEGRGIAAKDLTRIFQKFVQVEEGAMGGGSGSGLGLSIVQEVVSLHGGEVWAESTPGSGSTFTIVLPIKI